MKKYLVMGGILIVLIVLGVLYGVDLLALKTPTPPPVTNVRNITIRIPFHSWSFEPDHIDAKTGESVSITVVNEDDMEHGFAVEEYHLRESIPPRATTTLRTITLVTPGVFTFYCSVICGDGTVENGSHKGEHRGHFQMEGTLNVK